MPMRPSRRFAASACLLALLSSRTVLGQESVPSPAPAPQPVQGGEETVTIVESVAEERPLEAASARSVRERDLSLRPISRPSDLLRVTPGLVLVQHAGGGKANQYLLRGFDADHGTDLALSIDGVPINMVSHGHGQGFADTNFVIPELVERVDVAKGPYFVENGDFATAGAVDLVTRSRGESFVSGGGGSFATGRAVAIVAPRIDPAWHPLLALELVRTDGPFTHPEDFWKTNLLARLTWDVGPRCSLFVSASAYSGSWNASGQLPSRAVRSGQVGFFGALDPSEGGQSTRQSASFGWTLRPDAFSEIAVLAYLVSYDFTLYSNFTFLSRDPVTGDQIEQWDRRSVAGARVHARWLRQRHGLLFDSSLGADARTDAIDNGLFHDLARERLADVVDAGVHESSVGLWAKEEVQLVRAVRVVAGARADRFVFRVADRLEDLGTTGTRTSGVRGAGQISPKASVIVSPHRTTDVFLNFGTGFHSNDARGVVRGTEPVTPLARAVGYEVGARTRLLERRVELAASLWGLDLASETVWVGDEGTTEASGATRRLGVELEGRWQLLPWLFADADVTWSRPRFRENAGNGQAIALAPRLTASGGLAVLHPGGLRGGLRALHVGARPATEDGFLVAEGMTLLDAFASYRWRALPFEVGLTIENVLDTRWRSAQFATVTRLPGEAPTDAPPPTGACPAGTRVATAPASGNFRGCEDVSFTPGNPISIRVTGSYRF